MISLGEAIIVAIITGCFALLGTVVTVWAAGKKTDENLRTSQKVTDTKLEELTREVRKHNNFAERMPVVEEQIKNIFHQIDEIKKG